MRNEYAFFNVSSQRRRGNLLDTANINKIVVVLPALVVPHVIDDKQVRARILDQAEVHRETFLRNQVHTHRLF